MPRPRPPVDAEGYSRAVFHKRANYDGWARPEVVDPTGRQHPHKYVVRFAYYKSDGAEPGWQASHFPEPLTIVAADKHDPTSVCCVWQ